MGAATSSPSSAAAGDAPFAFASPRERAAFEKLVGRTPVAREDAAYQALLSTPRTLPTLSQAQLEQLTHEFGAAVGTLAAARSEWSWRITDVSGGEQPRTASSPATSVCCCASRPTRCRWPCAWTG